MKIKIARPKIKTFSNFFFNPEMTSYCVDCIMPYSFLSIFLELSYIACFILWYFMTILEKKSLIL